MKLILGESEYDVGSQVALMEKYKVYLCRNTEGKLLFLQIAREQCAEHDAVLDKSAYVLRILKDQSDKLEELYSKEHPGESIGYDRMFPVVVQSERTGADQGFRLVNILSIKLDPKDTVDIDMMVPLKKILINNQVVDEPTSAWIMGRFLKLFVFLDCVDVSIEVRPENVLLSGPEQHHNIVLFDWSKLEVGNGTGWRGKIASAAKTTLAALDIQDGRDISHLHPEYINFILELTKSTDSYSNPADIHRDFYEIVDGIWGTGYIPMKIIPK